MPITRPSRGNQWCAHRPGLLSRPEIARRLNVSRSLLDHVASSYVAVRVDDTDLVRGPERQAIQRSPVLMSAFREANAAPKSYPTSEAMCPSRTGASFIAASCCASAGASRTARMRAPFAPSSRASACSGGRAVGLAGRLPPATGVARHRRRRARTPRARVDLRLPRRWEKFGNAGNSLRARIHDPRVFWPRARHRIRAAHLARGTGWPRG